MKYNRQLMQAVLHGKVEIAKAVNATVITLGEAPGGYAAFDAEAALMFVLKPNRYVAA